MMLKGKKGFNPVWLVAVIAVIGIAAVGYFFYQSSSENNDPVNNQQTNVEQQEGSTEEKEEKRENNIDEKQETKGITITSGDSEFGTMLFNDEGQAIYIWELEESTKPECYGDCADAWPPVLTDGAPQAAGSVNGDLLGMTERTDGSTQVTYNGHPLYYYAHENVGEVKCHNVSTHGGLWWVIQPNGVRAD